jgi:hypothetical protein
MTVYATPCAVRTAPVQILERKVDVSHRRRIDLSAAQVFVSTQHAAPMQNHRQSLLAILSAGGSLCTPNEDIAIELRIVESALRAASGVGNLQVGEGSREAR